MEVGEKKDRYDDAQRYMRRCEGRYPTSRQSCFIKSLSRYLTEERPGTSIAQAMSKK